MTKRDRFNGDGQALDVTHDGPSQAVVRFQERRCMLVTIKQTVTLRLRITD